MQDLIIPIVFPEYRISITTPQANVDLFPWVNFDNFTIPSTKQKLSNLGHAGVLLVNGKSGVTKYFEYGRYDPPEFKGVIRKVPLPDAKVDQNGVVFSSLIPPLHRISEVAGQNGRLEAVLLKATNVFSKLNQMILFRKTQNINPKRQPYDIASNSCVHFVKWVVKASGNTPPWMVDPRPNSYIGEFRDDYPDLDYSPKSKLLKVEGVGEFR